MHTTRCLRPDSGICITFVLRGSLRRACSDIGVHPGICLHTRNHASGWHARRLRTKSQEFLVLDLMPCCPLFQTLTSFPLQGVHVGVHADAQALHTVFPYTCACTSVHARIDCARLLWLKNEQVFRWKSFA